MCQLEAGVERQEAEGNHLFIYFKLFSTGINWIGIAIAMRKLVLMLNL